MNIDMVGTDLGFSIGTCGKDAQGVPVSDAQPTLRIPEITVGGGVKGEGPQRGRYDKRPGLRHDALGGEGPFQARVQGRDLLLFAARAVKSGSSATRRSICRGGPWTG